jgi:hypothetical protein
MFLITKIKESKELNKVLLNLLEKIPNNPLKEGNDFIEKTDWNLPKDLKREYVEYFLKIIRPYLEKIAISFKSKKVSVSDIWFQQYTKSGVHQWHNHPYTNWTNVYFVELPSKYLATEILNYDKLNIEEGDMLTFPAYIYHRSPPNFSDSRKTIVSFNSNFYDFNNNVN